MEVGGGGAALWGEATKRFGSNMYGFAAFFDTFAKLDFCQPIEVIKVTN